MGWAGGMWRGEVKCKCIVSVLPFHLTLSAYLLIVNLFVIAESRDLKVTRSSFFPTHLFRWLTLPNHLHAIPHHHLHQILRLTRGGDSISEPSQLKKHGETPVWRKWRGCLSRYKSGNDAFGNTDDDSTALTDDWSNTESDDDSNNKFLLYIKIPKAA